VVGLGPRYTLGKQPRVWDDVSDGRMWRVAWGVWRLWVAWTSGARVQEVSVKCLQYLWWVNVCVVRDSRTLISNKLACLERISGGACGAELCVLNGGNVFMWMLLCLYLSVMWSVAAGGACHRAAEHWWLPCPHQRARPVGGSGTASVWLVAVAVAASAARRSVAALSLCIDAFIDLRSNSAYILSILFVNKKCPRYVCTNSNRFIHNPRREQEFSCVTFLDVNGSCRSTGTFSFL